MTDPIRVFHLIETLRPGGAEHLLLNTVRALDPRKVTSVVGSLFTPLDLREQFEQAGARVIPLSLQGRLDWSRGVIDLARVLRRERAEVVHTHLFYANFYGRVAARLAQCAAVVTTLHSTDYTHQDNGRLTFRLRKMSDRFTARYMTTVNLAVSEAVRDDYRHHLRLPDIQVLHNYVDPQRFVPLAAADRRAARASVGCSDDDFVLVNVGRLHWEKGQPFLARAMRRIVDAIPSARLVFVGDGPDEPQLRALLAADGVDHAVIFAGARADVRGLLACADVFVLPSNLEGLPISLLEAMAVGLPVVATRVGGIPEVVEDGADGRLVPKGDADAIADAVIWIHAQPQRGRALGQHARGTVERRFSVSVAMPQLEALYRRVAREGGHVAAA